MGKGTHFLVQPILNQLLNYFNNSLKTIICQFSNPFYTCHVKILTLQRG